MDMMKRYDCPKRQERGFSCSYCTIYGEGSEGPGCGGGRGGTGYGEELTGEGPGYERGGESPGGREEVEVRGVGKAVTAEGLEYEGGVRVRDTVEEGMSRDIRKGAKDRDTGKGKGSGIRIWVVWVRVTGKRS